MVAGYVSLAVFFLFVVFPCIARAFEREEYQPPPTRSSGTPW
jgi:hypothetical protein